MVCTEYEIFQITRITRFGKLLSAYAKTVVRTSRRIRRLVVPFINTFYAIIVFSGSGFFVFSKRPTKRCDIFQKKDYSRLNRPRSFGNQRIAPIAHAVPIKTRNYFESTLRTKVTRKLWSRYIKTCLGETTRQRRL